MTCFCMASATASDRFATPRHLNTAERFPASPMETRLPAASSPKPRRDKILDSPMETRLPAASIILHRERIEDSVQRSPRHLLQYVTGRATANSTINSDGSQNASATAAAYASHTSTAHVRRGRAAPVAAGMRTRRERSERSVRTATPPLWQGRPGLARHTRKPAQSIRHSAPIMRAART